MSTLLVGAARGYAWQVALDGVGEARRDVWETVAFHPSGDLIVAGLSYEYVQDEVDCIIVVARLARAGGAEVWRQEDHVTTRCFGVTSLLVDGSGDLVVERGSTVSKRAGTNGELLWEYALGEPAYDGPAVHASALDASGNVLFAGSVGKGDDNNDLVVAKIDSASGVAAWRKSISGTSTDYTDNFVAAVAADGAGDVIVLGELEDDVGTGDESFREHHPVALKLAAADGSELWRVATDRSQQVDGTVELVVDADRNLLQLAEGGRVVKRSGQNGAEIWRYQASLPGAFAAPRSTGIALGSSGDAYATWQWFGGPLGSSVGSSVFCARIDGSNGAERWHSAQAITEPLQSAPVGLAVDATGNALLAVQSESTAGHFDFLVVELAAADGDELWRFDVDGPDTSSEPEVYETSNIVQAIAVDGDRVAAVGSLVTSRQPPDGVAVVLTADGAESWRYTLRENDPSRDKGLALAIRADGDVVAAGTTTSAQGQSSFVVRRLGSADGRVAWTSDLGPGTATSVAVDVAGDVIAGGTLNRSDAPPSVVVKLAGDDGTERWRFAPRRSVSDLFSPVTIALAPNGDVFAALLRQDKAGRVRMILSRLAAADGSVVWRRQAGGGRGAQVVSLLVDSQANVLLGIRGNRSLLSVVKLDGASGAKRWMTRLGVSSWDAAPVLTPAGDVAVSGQVRSTVVEQRVLLLDGSTGKERWRRSLGQMVHGLLAVTPAGDVLAAANTQLPFGSGPDHATVFKLDGATGTPSWQRELHLVTADQACLLTRLASGANGDAVLGGCDLDELGGSRFDVLALAAADGVLRWHHTFSGPRTSGGFGSDYDPSITVAVSALAPDPFGNVVAVGSTDDGTHGLDFTVIKWAADGSDNLLLPAHAVDSPVTSVASEKSMDFGEADP